MAGSHGTGGHGTGHSGTEGEGASLAQLDHALRAIESMEAPGTRGLEVPAITLQQICSTYHDLKPLVEAILPFVQRISPPVALVIRHLMSLLDDVCAMPAPSPSGAATGGATAGGSAAGGTS